MLYPSFDSIRHVSFEAIAYYAYSCYLSHKN
jgi:hypothetical protein